ncbi:MAG: CCA tRNA nucleotidyltransferase [Gemmatimonadales bacterium]
MTPDETGSFAGGMAGRPRQLDLPVEILEIAATLEQAGHETWCVGGSVRDAVMGGARDDIDLATAATPEEVQALFPRTIPVGIKFGTIGVLDRHRQLHEVTTFRRDVATDGRHAEVIFADTIDEDLGRRDFTMNAIAYHPLRHEWRDPFGGTGDIAARLVRAVGVPGERFHEDYLRILRALRFASRFGFEIDGATWQAALEGVDGLRRLSAERVRDEWFRTLESARSVRRAFDLWRDVGAAAICLPGLREEYPLATDDPTPRDPVLLSALLVRGVGRLLEQLKASRVEIDRGLRIERGPAEPHDTSPVRVRRWLAQVEPGADDLLAAHRLRTGVDAPWASVVAGVRERGEATARSQLAVTGDDLRTAGIPPGPDLGRILGVLMDEVLDEPSRNERSQLLARALELR